MHFVDRLSLFLLVDNTTFVGDVALIQEGNAFKLNTKYWQLRAKAKNYSTKELDSRIKLFYQEKAFAENKTPIPPFEERLSKLHLLLAKRSRARKLLSSVKSEVELEFWWKWHNRNLWDLWLSTAMINWES